MANTAWSDGHRVLYHWQRYDEARLAHTLSTRQIYCSSPSGFNDPWDCKPHFNSEVLEDPAENERHVEWAVDLCSRKTSMSAADLEHMRATLLTDRAKATELLDQISAAMAPEINARYCVYCLGPDIGNLLMWAHYADNHRGICLEFDLRNDVLSGALRCEYLPEFPLMRIYDSSEEANLLILLAKGNAWAYEQEYRLIAQERAVAVSGANTLITDRSFLQLPEGALRSIIVGCQADYAGIRRLVERLAPQVRVKRADRVPNRYRIAIED
jgi:hypothetical protein